MSSSRSTRERCRYCRCWQVRGMMRGLEETTLQAPSPILRLHEACC